MTTHLFISYSHHDSIFARRLATALSELGADVWLDVEDIPAGMKWSTAIQQGLQRADVMLVVISPQSMASKHVEDEWQYFLDMNKPVIPLLWTPAELHFQLSRIQRIDFHRQSYNTALLQLLTEIQRLGCEIDIPPYLERTRRKPQPLSNAHPTHIRPPTAPRSVYQMPTLAHKPKPRRAYFASILLVVGLLALGMGVASMQPVAQSAVSTPTLEVTVTKPPRVTAPINANIRASDTVESLRVGILRAGEQAEIIGVNHTRSWWYIRFRVAGTERVGWVSAIVIRAKGDLSSVPVITP
jgi:hypothetical protein